MAPMAESFYKCSIRYYSIYVTILMRDEEEKNYHCVIPISYPKI